MPRGENMECAGGRQRAVVNPDESPIAWLRRRKGRNGEPMLSQTQFDAGERLRGDFWFAQMTPRTTTNDTLPETKQAP